MRKNAIPIQYLLRTFIALTLTFTMIASAMGQQPPGNPLAGYEVGSRVKLHLVDGRSLRGTIQSREPDAFMLRMKKAPPVRIAYAEVQSAERVKAQNTGGAVKWIVMGVVLGTVAIVAYVFLVRLHNEGAL